MQVYLGPRQSGRTTALVDWLMAKPDERGLIVMDTRERDRVLDLILKRLGGNHPEAAIERWSRLVVRPGEVYIRSGRAIGVEWAIDNLEEVLQHVLGVVPTIATGTNVQGLHIRELRS
jgi:hypothetical protein